MGEPTHVEERPQRKGSFTTRDGCEVPRIRTSSVVPIAEADLSTEASEIPMRRDGDIVPLVTWPTVLPLQEDAIPVSWDPANFHADADEPLIVVLRPLSLECVASDERPLPFHQAPLFTSSGV